MNIKFNPNNFYQYNSINKNSKQYQASAKDSLNDIIMSEMMMTPEQKMLYEMFGGREQVMKNRMQMYDSEGNLLNAHGIAGMCMNGVSLEEAHQIIDVPDEWKQKMFEETKRHFSKEYGIANGDTTKRSEVFQGYQRSTPVEDRLKGTWTLGQYEKAYRQAFYDAVKAENPDWELGKPFDRNILDKISREDIDNSLIKLNGEYGTELVIKRLDVSV